MNQQVKTYSKDKSKTILNKNKSKTILNKNKSKTILNKSKDKTILNKNKSKTILNKNKSKTILNKSKDKNHISYNKINKEYDPKLVHNFDIHKYFPNENIKKLNENNIKKIQMTNIGEYSISKPFDADWITNTIIQHYTKIYPQYIDNNNKLSNIDNTTIIDGTAGIGGNIISFAKKFNKVIGIEYNKIHYNVCKNNVSIFGYNNVELYNDSILNYYKKYDILKNMYNNIFFFDPPWGGSSYKKHKYVHLAIGGLHITQFLNDLYNKNYKYIVLKAPKNFIISDILLKTKYQNVHIKNYYNMILLFIF